MEDYVWLDFVMDSLFYTHPWCKTREDRLLVWIFWIIDDFTAANI